MATYPRDAVVNTGKYYTPSFEKPTESGKEMACTKLSNGDGVCVTAL